MAITSPLLSIFSAYLLASIYPVSFLGGMYPSFPGGGGVSMFSLPFVHHLGGSKSALIMSCCWTSWEVGKQSCLRYSGGSVWAVRNGLLGVLSILDSGEYIFCCLMKIFDTIEHYVSRDSTISFIWAIIHNIAYYTRWKAKTEVDR